MKIDELIPLRSLSDEEKEAFFALQESPDRPLYSVSPEDRATTMDTQVRVDRDKRRSANPNPLGDRMEALRGCE